MNEIEAPTPEQLEEIFDKLEQALREATEPSVLAEEE